MRIFSILLISLISINALTACESKADKIAEMEHKVRLAQQEHYECVMKSEDQSGKGCEKLKQERDRLEKEYEKLVKS